VVAGMYEYFLKVVPTSYTSLRNETTQSNQYSVTENYRAMDAAVMAANNLPPAIVFFYDISAIKVCIQGMHVHAYMSRMSSFKLRKNTECVLQ
jgi:endoplasmic reticulum-Golgi intermediate compartment protein 3